MVISSTHGRVSFVVGAALALAWPGAISADAGGPAAAPLSLVRCVAIALERHPAIRAIRQGERAALAAVDEQRAAYFPRIGVDAGVIRSTAPFDAAPGVGYEDESRALLTGSLLIFDGGARSGRVGGAQADSAVARALADTVTLDVVFGVALAYYERLAAEGIAGVAGQTVQQVALHVKLAEARLASGVAARYDVLKAKTLKADADLALVRARGTVRAAEGALARSMGLPVTATLSIDPLPEVPLAEVHEGFDRLLARAGENRPELKAARARIAGRQAEVRTAVAGYMPTVVAGGDFGLGALSPIPDRTRWSAGIALAVPLFEGMLTPARRARAVAEEARAAEDRLSLHQDVELEVWNAHVRLAEAQEARIAASVLVASAEESARVVEGMYKNGVASIIELVDAQTARTAAQTRRVLAALDLQLAAARLGRAVGQAPDGGPRAATLGGGSP